MKISTNYSIGDIVYKIDVIRNTNKIPCDSCNGVKITGYCCIVCQDKGYKEKTIFDHKLSEPYVIKRINVFNVHNKTNQSEVYFITKNNFKSYQQELRASFQELYSEKEAIEKISLLNSGKTLTSTTTTVSINPSSDNIKTDFVCNCEFINVGFNSIKMACKFCGKNQS